MSLVSSLTASSLLALLAWRKRALTAFGSVLAWALCILISAAGGWTAFTVLTATLLGTVAADKAAGGRADPDRIRRKSGTRGAVRVLCNVGVGAAAMAIFLLSHRTAFAVTYAAVMAESLADSLASKLGPLSAAPPRDLCTGRPVPAGLSGGVTWLGTAAELLGAAVIAGIWGVGTRDLRAAIIVLAAGFFGAVADSLFGSRLQVKYRCPVCGAVTERETHCGLPTEKVSGLRHINNDTVNFMSNAAAFLIALLLMCNSRFGAVAF